MGLGGSERLVHNLALRLDRSRFSASVAWLYGEEILQEFRDLQVPLHHVPKLRRVDLGTMRALARIVRAEHIDVVNAQHFMPAVYAYYACNVAARKPLIFTAHSRWEVEQAPFKWRIAGSYLLNRIAASVAVSPDVSAAVRGVFGLDASRVVTIENGVDIDAFAGQKDVRDLRGSLRLAEADFVIGIVANLKKVKNHLFLLQAFAQVAREVLNAKLLLVGQGFPGEQDNTEDELRRFVADHDLGGKVSFLGYRADIPELLRVMDVFCLTSLKEGLPIGLIEAMAAGLPVVGTNVAGIRDVVTPDEDGVLVELGGVTALKDALVRLLQDERRRQALGRAGRRKAVEKYSLQRCVREYEQLFVSLAQR
jgi:glycosyltransferase involved in cell wall biosynthesis